MIKSTKHIKDCNRCSSHLYFLLENDINECKEFLENLKNNFVNYDVNQINEITNKFNEVRDLLLHIEFADQRDNNTYYYFLEDEDINKIIEFFTLLATLNNKFYENLESIKDKLKL